MRFRAGKYLSLISVLLTLCEPMVGQFETRSTASASLNPRSIAVGDFNGDKKLDLAVASQGSSSQDLTILLGNGDGTFRPGIHYKISNGLYSVATADFNHDGKMDLVAADYYSSAVSVLLGNGDGTFQTATNYPLLAGPISVLAGDFNGDQWPDIVALQNYQACFCVSVLLNNRDGTFGSAINTDLPPPYALAMTIGDYDRDGNLDIATTGYGAAGSALNILHGSGDGTFTFGASYYADFSSVITTADLRGNGLLDLIVANQGTPSIYVFLGTGDGTFTSSGVGYPGAATASLAAADFNGDGKIDLAATDTSNSTVIVLSGNGDGTFNSGVGYPIGKDSLPVVVGDFNGDRKADLATAGFDSNSATVLLNTGVVSFSPTTPLNFKKVKVGTTSAPLTVTLTNTGKSALTISSMKATGQFAMTSTCGSSVAAGANCAISVTFSPTSTGLKSGTVTLHDSASSKPMVIELSGTGT